MAVHLWTREIKVGDNVGYSNEEAYRKEGRKSKDVRLDGREIGNGEVDL